MLLLNLKADIFEIYIYVYSDRGDYSDSMDLEAEAR